MVQGLHRIKGRIRETVARPVGQLNYRHELPRLTIRELFLLVLIAAIGCGWWVDHIKLATELEALKLEQLTHLIQTTIVPESSTLLAHAHEPV